VTDLPKAILSGVRVLVVVDAKDILEPMRLILQFHGATALTASSAFEAFDVLARERVDVLMTDLDMPNVDGYELLRTIREWGSSKNADVPAVAVSGYLAEAPCAGGRADGFAAYLEKPVRPETIVSVVADIVAR
jgi:CheY-like chemotaxis protein